MNVPKSGRKQFQEWPIVSSFIGVRRLGNSNSGARREYFLRAQACLLRMFTGVEKKVEIRTKSEFLVKVISEWLPMWKANEWKEMDGGKIQDLDEIKLFDEAMASAKVRVVSCSS